jgi:hypothetical protein
VGKKKFARNVKSGVDQKVSKTPETEGLNPSWNAEGMNPILEMVASKAAARKHLKAELKGELKRAKADINQVMKEFDVAKHLTDVQEKGGLA